MTWLLIGVLIWVAVAIPVAVLVGRSIRLADTRPAVAEPDVAEANFVATDLPVEGTPVEPVEQPWTGPETVPFAPSRLPWGGDRTASRPPPPVIRHPVKPVEREAGARDAGMS
jgi:hypothetical protein